MADSLEFKLLLLLLIANGAPIMARLLLDGWADWPLDGGRKTAAGRPWLGPSKTIRGLLAAVVACGLGAPLLGLDWIFGMGLGALSMLGDLLASFTKRRLGMASSSQAIGLDQIPESLIPLGYAAWQQLIGWRSLVLLVLLFWLSEMLLSQLLFRLRIRRHPY